MAIRQNTFMTFVDISNQGNPVAELVGIIHSRRERVMGVVQVPRQGEKGLTSVYCLLLKPIYGFDAQGDSSVIVYYLDSWAGEADLTDTINNILNQNQVKIFEAIPDPPRRQRQGAQSYFDTLNKNEWHQYLERKIKELNKT